MEPLRLRLKFADTSLLSKSQRVDGLKRSWVLVEPRHRTISDVVSHILHTFDLWDSCPNGILLSMEGFFLPHSESTAILKDKDLVCVKRKGAKLFDVIKECGEEKATEEQKVVEKLPIILGVPLLANEEFEKETGGYPSETEEDEDNMQNDFSLMPNASIRKRKASKQLKNSKRKRQRENDDHSAQKEHAGSCLQKGDCQKKSSKSKQDHEQLPEDAGKNLGAVKCTAHAVCSSVENKEGTVTPSSVPDGTIKVSVSRSTRRAKAKRQRRRALRIVEKVQLLMKQSQSKDPNADVVFNKDQNLDAQQHPKESDQGTESEDEIVPVVVRPGHIRFAAAGKGKDVQQCQEEKGSFNWHGSINKKKGQKWGKERQSSSKRNEDKAPYKKQTASKWNEFESMQEKQPASKWNEQSRPRWNDYKTRGKNWAAQKAPPANASMDYEKLVPMADFPVQGDTIAYRLLELSSTFCPELTTYRVGKVSSSDPESNRVTLVPVPEYPFEFKKAVDGTSEELPDGPDRSHYKEDGSLEIDFPSLADVRIVKRADLNPGTALRRVANGNPASGWKPTSGSGWRTETPVGSKDPSSQAQPTSNKWTGMKILASSPAPASGSGWRTRTPSSSKDPPSQAQPTSNNWTGIGTFPAPENGKKDVWEEISAAVSAKKEELLKEDNWNKKRKSSNQSWSYRTPRSGGLGRTMALLRGGNGRQTN